ncbi:MAG: amidohydrolase [Lachnospiraceae bacterium]|nr:amidohydrolase [Lachnospiraceae bacterium]
MAENYIIIDAHVHLWEKQAGFVDGKPVYSLGNGKSSFLGGVHQMMPPYMEDNRNTAERLIANMDYAGVCACAVTQEYLDGNQDEYLLATKAKYPDRFRITALYEDVNMPEAAFIDEEIAKTDAEKHFYKNDSEKNLNGRENPDHRSGSGRYRLNGFDGLKICACRLKDKDLTHMLDVFKTVEAAGKYISIDMADGDKQTDSMREVIEQCPDLRIAIGHFGMVTTPGWQKQIELARYKNVYIESGGLTWLFHKEFYPYPSAINAILEARDICGIEKLMWGSDYPRTMTDITYKSAVRFILESSKLTDTEKRAFLGENAVKFYGFKGLEPLPEIDNML